MKAGLAQGQSPEAHHTIAFWHWIKQQMFGCFMKFLLNEISQKFGIPLLF